MHNLAIETKSADLNADPIADVRTALEGLTSDVEKKTAPVADLAKRLDAIEAKANRLDAANDNDEQTVEQKAFGAYLRQGNSAPAEELKALTVGDSAQAGYLAPPEFGAEILKALREFSPIRQYARVVTIGAPEIRYPRRTGSTAATWVGETAARTESGPSYEQVTLTPHEMATFVEVSRQLLEDNSYNLEGELGSDLAESFAITEGAAFVNGTGTGQPVGLLTSTAITAETGTLDGDGLIDLFYSIPTYHAQRGVFVMNRNTLAEVRKLKNTTTGDYIWQPGIQADQPGTLLGRPIVEAVDMPDPTVGNTPIIFGDLSGYRIVDRVSIGILSDPYSGAKSGIHTFHARKRVGADVTNPDRLRKFTVSA